MAGAGGAWKVAYADFVTAMMAFFLVMWLLGYDEETRQAIEDYFTGRLNEEVSSTRGEGNRAETLPFIVPPDQIKGQQILEMEELMQAARKVIETFQNSPELSEDVVRFEFLADGMRITVLDRSQRPLFRPGTAEMTQFGEWVLRSIAWQIDRFPLSVEIEGHVQRDVETQGNAGFILSSSRAEAARSVLQRNGIDPDRFYRVIGYADRSPLEPENPSAEDNRRISILARIRDPADIERLKSALSRY